jgi:hypothetical protein
VRIQPRSRRDGSGAAEAQVREAVTAGLGVDPCAGDAHEVGDVVCGEQRVTVWCRRRRASNWRSMTCVS